MPTPASIAKNGSATLIKEITDLLKAGEDVVIPGLGKFKVVSKAARTGRNPRTGEAVSIAAHKAVKFHQTSTLKAALNGD